MRWIWMQLPFYLLINYINIPSLYRTAGTFNQRIVERLLRYVADGNLIFSYLIIDKLQYPKIGSLLKTRLNHTKIQSFPSCPCILGQLMDFTIYSIQCMILCFHHPVSPWGFIGIEAHCCYDTRHLIVVDTCYEIWSSSTFKELVKIKQTHHLKPIVTTSDCPIRATLTWHVNYKLYNMVSLCWLD